MDRGGRAPSMPLSWAPPAWRGNKSAVHRFRSRGGQWSPTADPGATALAPGYSVHRWPKWLRQPACVAQTRNHPFGSARLWPEAMDVANKIALHFFNKRVGLLSISTRAKTVSRQVVRMPPAVPVGLVACASCRIMGSAFDRGRLKRPGFAQGGLFADTANHCVAPSAKLTTSGSNRQIARSQGIQRESAGTAAGNGLFNGRPMQQRCPIACL